MMEFRAAEHESSSGEDEAEEVGAANRLAAPRPPIAQEKELHQAIHLPFQPWCGVCIGAKGRRRAHRSPVRWSLRDDAVAVVAFDYHFFGTEGAHAADWPTLVMVDTNTGNRWARMLPAKGLIDNPWLVREISE